MSANVLLVDDEIHILRAAEFKLKRSGYAVRLAMNGEEAWQSIQRQSPDIVVTDVQMPRMTGIELVQRMRAEPETATIPVIMLTAKGLELPKQAMVSELRLFDIMSKPFSPKGLCRAVEQALEQSTRTVASE